MTPPLCAYAVLMYAAMLHVIEGIILLHTSDADGSIGLHALLGVIPTHGPLALALFAASAAAFVVLWRYRRLSAAATIILLAPQQAFLITTAMAAWLAVWNGSYADHVIRSSFFITADQLPRGMFSMIHLTAIYSIAVFRTRQPYRGPVGAGERL